MATKWLLQIEVQIVKVPLPGLEPRPIISRASMLTTTPQRNLKLHSWQSEDYMKRYKKSYNFASNGVVAQAYT